MTSTDLRILSATCILVARSEPVRSSERLSGSCRSTYVWQIPVSGARFSVSDAINACTRSLTEYMDANLTRFGDGDLNVLDDERRIGLPSDGGFAGNSLRVKILRYTVKGATNLLTFPSVDITGHSQPVSVKGTLRPNMSESPSGPLQNIYYKRVRYLLWRAGHLLISHLTLISRWAPRNHAQCATGRHGRSCGTLMTGSTPAIHI
jgi:hypothetical protein